MSRASAAPSHGHDLILGRYRAVRPLGSGGSGTVWLARDEREGREVALKIVPREGKAGERAEREALAVARIRSPRCARAYSVARDERHVYVAYEYIPGKTLRESIRAGELNDGKAVEAGAQMLEALDHAHRKGIVHRDVKPANVLLEESDEVSVRLLDFGLAQLDEADTLTAAGDVPGTLAYISPERLEGKPSTGAADVWAVGVILWESLAGYQPFWSSSPVETARLIGTGAPPLRTVRPDLPKPLTSAVDRALAGDPRRRPAPQRLADELRAAQAADRRNPQAGSRPVLVERSAHAALAAAFVALAAWLFPFYPPVLTATVITVCAIAAFLVPRLGLALALAAPALPLGNVSTGLAMVYLAVAALWLAFTWGDAPRAFLLLAGPLLALVGAAALTPLVAEQARGAGRRVGQGAAAILLAAAVAGMRGAGLPLTGARPPKGLGIAESESATAVAGALWRAVEANSGIAFGALAVGAAAAALPIVRGRGLWWACGLGASFMAAGLLAPLLGDGASTSSLEIVLPAWILTAAAAWPTFRALASEGSRFRAVPTARESGLVTSGQDGSGTQHARPLQ